MTKTNILTFVYELLWDPADYCLAAGLTMGETDVPLDGAVLADVVYWGGGNAGVTITYLRGGTVIDRADTVPVPYPLRPRLAELYRDGVDPLGLLPAEFTLNDAYALHQAIRGVQFAKRDAFRRWAEPLLVPIGRCTEGVVGRPAALFRMPGAVAA